MTRPHNWSGRDGAYWADHDERFDALLAPLTRHLLAAADIEESERVLDVGCGCGNTTRLAGRAAASAHGVDLSTPMLAKARQRTAEAGLDNVTFEQTDAQIHTFGRFDVVMSQLGVMFFEDPVAAFTNLRRTGGRLVFLCWQGMEFNEPRLVKHTALAPHVEIPMPPAGTGPMSLADPDRVREVLGGAGYTDVTLTSVREPCLIGRTVEEALAMELGQPAVAEALERAGAAAAARAADSLRDAYAARYTGEGVYLNAAAWLVSAG